MFKLLAKHNESTQAGSKFISVKFNRNNPIGTCIEVGNVT